MSVNAIIEYKGRDMKPCQLSLKLLMQDSVKELKAKIHRVLSVPAHMLRLFCGNFELQEEDNLLNFYSYIKADNGGRRSLRLQLIM